jgi:hypothetical protein
MSREAETTKVPILTEDTKIKTNVKTVIGVVVCAVIGTAYFVAVMYKLSTMDNKIDYLYHATNTFNPFNGDYNATSRLPTIPVPAP